jgi:predicted MFS family arabinose efflux permease
MNSASSTRAHAPAPRTTVWLLSACQALLLTNGVTLIAVSALAGYMLAENKAFATVPATAYVLGSWFSTVPASLWMKRVGPRAGFMTGGVFGIAGSAVASLGMAVGSLAVLAAGTFLFGIYNAFGQYYRFAAADAAPADLKAKAISFVLAGGLVGGIVGPAVSRWTRDLAQPTYLATFASLAFFTLLAMAILSRLSIPPHVEGGGQAAPPRSLAQIAAQPVFIVAATVAGFGYATMTLLMTATPLAMGFCGHPYSAAANVISAHVVGMFAPSFFTGSLIKRFGVLTVMAVGVAILFACIAIGLSGQAVAHFWWALVLLGIGWNFTYIGGSTLLTEAYLPSEKAKAQGANEMTVFTVQALASFSSGALVNTRGWDVLNYVAIPMVAVCAIALAWLAFRRRLRPA